MPTHPPSAAALWTCRALTLLYAIAARAAPEPPSAVPEPPSDAPPSEPAPPNPTAMAPAPATPPSYAEGYLWVGAGPRTVGALSDVTIHPTDPGVWAIATDDGAVWITVDAGRRWLAVLDPVVPESGAADEEIATEVEGRLAELAPSVEVPDEQAVEDGEMDPEELEDLLQTAAEDATNAAQELIDEVVGEVEDGPWFLDADIVATALRVRPKTWFTRDGLLVVTRLDGVRVSEDLGASWQPVLDEPATAFTELAGGGYVLGTAHGLRGSTSLRDWFAIDALGDAAVYDVVDAGGLYACTADGLWYTADPRAELGYIRLLGWYDDVYTVVPMPAPGAEPAPAPLVLGALDTLWYAAAPLDAPARAVAGPVPRVLELTQRPDGLLLAASVAGPFASVDRGATWTPIGSGLDQTARDVRDIASVGDLVLAATAAGLQRIAPIPPEAHGAPAELAEWVPLGALMDAALGRPELTARPGARALSALLPEVTARGTWNQDVGDDWDADTWTLRGADHWWEAGLTFTWRPGARGSSFEDDAGANIGEDLSVFVFDDEILVDDRAGTHLLASKVNRRASAYASDVAETVSNLYQLRQRIALEARVLAGEPLFEQSLRTLQLAEVEARLDALTNGAVTSYAADPRNPSTGGGGR